MASALKEFILYWVGAMTMADKKYGRCYETQRTGPKPRLGDTGDLWKNEMPELNLQ